MNNAVTWYDVLGVVLGAAPDDIRAAWRARREALDPRLLAGDAGPDASPVTGVGIAALSDGRISRVPGSWTACPAESLCPARAGARMASKAD